MKRPARIETATYLSYRGSSRNVFLIAKSEGGLTLDQARRRLQKRHPGIDISFGVNSGIFEQGYRATGLLIQEHKVLHPLNTRPGKGNFYMQPNAVFYVDKNQDGTQGPCNADPGL